MKKTSSLFKLCAFLIAFIALGSTRVWARSYTSYGYAKIAKGNGSGKVYVGTAATNNPTYNADGSETNKTSNNQTSAPTHTYHFYAQPEAGSVFVGWYDNESHTGTAISNKQSDYTANASWSGTTGTITLYAYFVKVYFSTANASAVGGGQVYVGAATTGSPSYAASSNAEITNENTSHTYHFYAKADKDFVFNGWFDNEGCTGTAVSKDTHYEVAVTASGTQGSPANKTLYASFTYSRSEGFANPISGMDAADPSVILAKDGYYYVYTSEAYSGQGINVYRSSDMVNWTKISNIFPDGDSKRPATSDLPFLWAPDINYIDGKYVMYFANSQYSGSTPPRIMVCYSDNPYSNFSTPVELFNSTNVGVGNSIDPDLFQEDGRNYLVWGSWNGIYYIELTSDGLNLKNGVSSKAAVCGGTNTNWKELEAPMVYKKDGYYYLIASYGAFNDPADGTNHYRLKMARGTALGANFYNKNGQQITNTGNRCSELLVSNDYVLNPGHCSHIITDANGQDWIFYHGYGKVNGQWNMDGGRLLFVSKVSYDAQGWPIIDAPSAEPIDMPAVKEVIPTGFFEIYNADDLEEYSYRVNNGETTLNGMLMNDIDCSSITDWTPIGTDANRFRGTFDGQGFRIKNLTLVQSKSEQALFWVATGGAYFKNLIIDGSCVMSGTNRTAAILNCSNGSGVINFENCGNEANVTGTGNNCGAISGGHYGSCTVIFNKCYNTGNITGDAENAVFSGWGASNVINCWNSGQVTGLETNQEEKAQNRKNSLTRGMGANSYLNTFDLCAANSPISKNVLANYQDSWMASGQLTYELNQKAGNTIWYQNIDDEYGTYKDAHPTFLSGHAIVYKNNTTYYNIEKPLESYTRSVTNGNYGTICLPYASTSYEGADFYKVAGVRRNSENKIIGVVIEKFEEDEQLEAGKPYIFKANDTSLTVYYEGAPVSMKVGRSYGMIGNLSSTKIKPEAGTYFLYQGHINEVTATVTTSVGENRAYFSFDGVEEFDDTNASVVKTYVGFGLFGYDDTDAIESLNANQQNGAIYNIMGQRVNANAKGLLIKNGKKILVK